MANSFVAKKEKLSVKTQTLAALAAVVAAVVLPQICHVAGSSLGMGNGIGEMLLPMHLPVMLVGLLAGPYAGAVSGLLGPTVSFALSGMPVISMLPFMMIELCAYGFAAGMLRQVKMPVILKVFIIQVAGRAIRAIAVLTAVYGFGNQSVKVASIWLGIKAGVIGILVQLLVIPVMVKLVEKR